MSAPSDRMSAMTSAPGRPAVDPRVLDLIAEMPIEITASASADERRAVAGTVAPLLRGPGAAAVGAAVHAEDESIETEHGPVRVRRYRGPDSPSLGAPVVVFLHGGGWVAGSVDSYDVDVRRLVDRTGLTVVSVEYRLAPEWPFPAGLQDCIEVVKAIAADPRYSTIGIAGDSAGGNLTLECAIALAAEAVDVAALLMLYPVVHPDGTGRRSYRENGAGYLLTEEDMAYYWQVYDPSGVYSDAVRARYALDAGLPPTVLSTAGYDPLHDEGAELAQMLVSSDVQLTYLPNPSLTHGYQQMVPRIRAAERALYVAYDAFRAVMEASRG